MVTYRPMLVDTHAHLTSDRFLGKVPELLHRCDSAGVSRVVSIGCDLPDSRAALALAKEHGAISAAVGIHPCYVDEPVPEGWIDELRELSAEPEVVAIGEIGLDYYHAPPEPFTVDSWRQQQADFFRAQLDLAREVALPVVIHQRESGDDTLDILEAYPEVLAVLHCFTGTLAQAERALAMGHYLSFTGVVTYKKAEEVRKVAAMVPEDRFMVETDAPYLAPVPFRGKSNEPAYVVHTAKQVAETRGISEEECARLSSENAMRFFRGLELP